MKKELSSNGARISYHVVGAGNPVMLVHGFGEDSRIFDQQVSFLKDHCLLIIPDLPGSGSSELTGDMSMEGMAAVLRDIINLEKHEKICMIGHSMGGYITLAFAEKFPGMLNSFGLFHSSAYADSAEKIATRKKGIEFIKSNGAFEFLKTSTPNLYSDKSKKERPSLVEGHLNSMKSTTDDSLIKYYEAMIARPDRTAVLSAASVPVLFIIGEHDKAVPKKDMLEQTRLPEEAHIHLLADSGHMGMVEETDLSNRYLKRFISRD